MPTGQASIIISGPASSMATGLFTTEALMILKVTVLKGSVDIFSVNIDVRQPSELSTGVKAALDEFRRVSPKHRFWTAISKSSSIRHKSTPTCDSRRKRRDMNTVARLELALSKNRLFLRSESRLIISAVTQCRYQQLRSVDIRCRLVALNVIAGTARSQQLSGAIQKTNARREFFSP
jgi:hypothetical protein